MTKGSRSPIELVPQSFERIRIEPDRVESIRAVQNRNCQPVLWQKCNDLSTGFASPNSGERTAARVWSLWTRRNIDLGALTGPRQFRPPQPVGRHHLPLQCRACARPVSGLLGWSAASGNRGSDEDRTGAQGSDFDYSDLIFAFTNLSRPAPEPTTPWRGCIWSAAAGRERTERQLAVSAFSDRSVASAAFCSLGRRAKPLTSSERMGGRAA